LNKSTDAQVRAREREAQRDSLDLKRRTTTVWPVDVEALKVPLLSLLDEW
jgi:hypothetical protein